jgi:hypothetical protein
MDRRAVLAAFDEQVRRNPVPDAPGERVERDGAVVRVLGGWTGVVWSDLSEATADAMIAEQVARFGGVEWEWKHFSYDRPSDLRSRLLAAGFEAEPDEVVMVAEIAELALDVEPPPGVSLRPVVDAAGVDALVRVHDEVFGEDHSVLGRELVSRLARPSPSVAAVVAMAGDEPIGAGRVEFHEGTEFASLWGDGTVARWRGRGVYRSIVAHRAALAAARGFRYLEAEAMPDSRPILARLGFAELAVTTPFIHPGG